MEHDKMRTIDPVKRMTELLQREEKHKVNWLKTMEWL